MDSMKLNQESLMILMTIVQYISYLQYRSPVVKRNREWIFFPRRCFDRWKYLSEEIVSSETVMNFRTKLDKFLMPDRYNLAEIY